MHRTQVQLTESQIRALKELAATQNKSMAELIRHAVDMLLRNATAIDREERKRRAIAAAGRFRSSTPDLSTEHDRYLSEAYTDESVR